VQRGHEAMRQAREATLRALDTPIEGGAVTMSAE